jgi:hypothetical protein
MSRGLIAPVAGIALTSALFVPAVDRYASNPPGSLFGDLAQVGATLLVAFAVEVSWALKVSTRRGRDSANWAGFGAGLGACGVVGIACALALSAHGTDALSVHEEFAFAWSAASLGMLGLFAGIFPLVAYEWAHAVRTEYPNE